MSTDLETILDLIPSARGAKGSKRNQPEPMVQVRELGPQDLPALLEPKALGSKTPLLTRLRTRHHTIARLCADGLKHGEIAAITGCAVSHVSILQNDPAFQELLAYYKGQKEAIYLDVHQKLANLGTSAVEELQSRLEEVEDLPLAMRSQILPTRTVVEMATMALDRGVAPSKVGAGGSGQATSININFVAPKDQGPVLEGRAEGAVVGLE